MVVKKEPACQCRRRRSLRFDPWVGTIVWKRKWQPSPVFLPGKWTEGPGGLQSMGLQRVAQVSGTEHTLADQTIATFPPLSTRGRTPPTPKFFRLIPFPAVLRKVIQRQTSTCAPTPTLIPWGSLSKAMAPFRASVCSSL